MSALGKFTIVILTTILFLELIGVPTGGGLVLNSFGVNITQTEYSVESADVSNSWFYNKIFGASVGILLVVGAAGAVIIGFFAKSYDTSLVILPLILGIGGLLASTSWTIISYANGLHALWLTKIVTVVFIALGIGFLWACVDYFHTRT